MRNTVIGLMFLACVVGVFGVANPLASFQYYGGFIKIDTAHSFYAGPATIGMTVADAEILVSKNGGAFAARGTTTTAGVESGSTGMYLIVLGADDVSALGKLQVMIDDATLDGAECVATFDVVTADYYNMMFTADTMAAVSDIWATGVVTADVIAADAIGSSELAASAATEIAAASWNALWTSYTTENSFGWLVKRMFDKVMGLRK
jgi:hypothetical protein